MQVNSYNSNPIGCLQERMQKQGLSVPIYSLSHDIGAPHCKSFVMTVSLADGSRCEGAGPNKKAAKQAAARLMLDVLDGKAKLLSEEMSQSIDLGLKALRESVNQHAQLAEAEAPMQNRGRTDDEEEEDRFGAFDRKSPVLDGFGLKSPLPEVPAQPILANPGQTLDEWLADLVLDAAWRQINRESRAEEICKLCNLVFINEVKCELHKTGRDHKAVVQGIYPGASGYHCLLCWSNYIQPESLLNHIARPNHQSRANEAGVLKIWMEPEPLVPTWDTLHTYRHLRKLAEEEERRGRRSRSPRPRSISSSRSSETPRTKGRKDLGSDMDWRVAQRQNWREEEARTEEEQKRWRRLDGEQRKRRPYDSGPRRPYESGSRQPYDPGSRLSDSTRPRNGRGDYFEPRREDYRRDDDDDDDDDDRYCGREDYADANRRFEDFDSGGRGRGHHYLRPGDIRAEPPGRVSGGDLRDHLVRRRRRESSGRPAASERSRSPSAAFRSSSMSSEPARKRKKHKSKKKKKHKKRSRKEISDEEEEGETEEEEEGEIETEEEGEGGDTEVEEGELKERARGHELSLHRVKSAVLGILDDEIFSIRTAKK